MAKDRLTTWENALVLVDDADGGPPFLARHFADLGKYTIAVPSEGSKHAAGDVTVLRLTPHGKTAHWVVLWSSPGVTTVEYTRRYAAALLAAVRLAERLNATERREEVTA